MRRAGAAGAPSTRPSRAGAARRRRALWARSSSRRPPRWSCGRHRVCIAARRPPAVRRWPMRCPRPSTCWPGRRRRPHRAAGTGGGRPAAGRRAAGGGVAAGGRRDQLGRRPADVLDDRRREPVSRPGRWWPCSAASERYGAPLAASLDRVADEARMQRRRRAEERGPPGARHTPVPPRRLHAPRLRPPHGGALLVASALGSLRL